MKLLACHVDNFGKLSNLSLEFNDGMNVFNQPNAWGKSTLAAFLKSMFYGLDAKKETRAFEKERVMYRPWQGGPFGGELDFEIDGKQYRISRSFGRTEKTDEFHLYDLSTNLECEDFSQNIGLELFGLDSASFKRSIYIAQNDCACETSDQINAKLGDLAQNTNDIINYEDAMRRMKEKLNQLTPERITGSIKKRKSYITELMQELRSYESAEEGIQCVKKKIKTLSLEIEELQRVRKNYAQMLILASEESKRKVLYAQYEEMCKEEEEKRVQMETLSSFFSSGVPAINELQEQIQIAHEMKAKEGTISSYELTMKEYEVLSLLEEKYKDRKPTDEQIEGSIQMLLEIEKQKEEIVHQEYKLSMLQSTLEEIPQKPNIQGEKSYKVILGLGLLLFVSGIAIFLISELKKVIGVAFIFLAVIFFLVGFFIVFKVNKKTKIWKKDNELKRQALMEQVSTIENVIHMMKEDVEKVYHMINAFLLEYNVICKKEEYTQKLYEIKSQLQEYERLSQKKRVYEGEKESLLKIKTLQDDFMKKYAFSSVDNTLHQLNLLHNKAIEYDASQKEYEYIVKKKETFEKNQSASFWNRKAPVPYRLEELNTLIKEADDKLENLKEVNNQYERQLEDLKIQLDARDEKFLELEEQLKQQEIDQKSYDTVRFAYDFMQKAKEQLTARYMNPIQTAFEKYFKLLTKEYDRSCFIDANIEVKFREQGELRNTKNFSAGYQDLIGVCMRLALVDAMYQKEKPFLLLDDPFVNLDMEKLDGGMELLRSVSNEYQMIYFTCHNSRNPQ